MKPLIVSAALALTVAACGGSDDPLDAVDDGGTASTTTTPITVPFEDWPDDPPPVVFESAAGPIERAPFTVCWSEPIPDDPDEEFESYCADGVPEASPPVIEPVDGIVTFSFAVADWNFSATVQSSGRNVAIDQLDETVWSFQAPGLAPDDVLIVSGVGPQGDVHVAIALPDGVGGPIDEPDAGAGVAVEVWDRCADGISVRFDDLLYLLDGDLEQVAPDASFPWDATDFPAEWDVEIMNDQPVDGDGFVIRDAEAEPIDDTTLTVRHTGTGDEIGTFVLDERTPDERFLCG